MFRVLNKHHQVLKQQFMRSANDAKANTKKQNHATQKKSQNSFISSTESATQLLTLTIQ